MRRVSRRIGKKILTHHSVAKLGLIDNGKMTRANSISPGLAHWFDMESSETSPTSGMPTVKDSITGVIVENDDVSRIGAVATTTPNALKCDFQSNNAFGYKAIPSGYHRVFITVAKAIFADDANPAPNGGHIAFAPGADLRCRQVRLHYLSYESETTRPIKSNKFCRGGRRQPNVDYVIGAVERYCEQLEHYMYHDQEGVTRLVGKSSISDQRAKNVVDEYRDPANYYDPSIVQQFWLSHSSSTNNPAIEDAIEYFDPNYKHGSECGGYLSGSDGAACDYYGVMMYYCKELPNADVIEDMLEWCRVNWPKGNKVAPPHMVSL